MLGQSKTAYQAEIDTPCELIDFWRFNVHFARQILQDQPVSSPGVWNRVDYRPLEGFVYAITPFNFTAIAGNLPTAPALMGNTVLWKPSPTQAVAAYLTMQLLEAAGLPAGVINLVLGDGPMVSEVALADPRLSGIHFTGSTATFQRLWREVGHNISNYHGYPRLVGETGGKDFIVAHSSADPDVLATALIRGAFDYQGQKCSAASRAFVPQSLWAKMGDSFIDQVSSLTYGDVTDLSNFGGAVIDQRAFDRNAAAIDRAKATDGITIAAGGTYDDSEGFFIAPTVLLGNDPSDEAFSTEYFGPILAVNVYDDSRPEGFSETSEGGRLRLGIRPHRLGDRDGSRRGAAGQQRVALCRRQLLRQRQAQRCGRRPAAVRRRSGVGHQRQGGLRAEPAALDLHPDDQGNLRPADPLPLRPPGPEQRTGQQVTALSSVLRPALLGAARSSKLEQLVSRFKPTRRVVDRFVPGESQPAVVSAAATLLQSGRFVSVDFLGEDTTDSAMATKTVEAYLSLLRAYGALATPESTGARPLEVSLKLSAMGQALPDVGQDVALANARMVCEAAAEVGAWVTIDAEDHTTTDSTLAIVRELRRDFPDLGTVLQAYLKRTEADCREFSGPRSRIRLCKGAYQEPSSVAFTKRGDVDSSYLRCLRVLMNGKGYPMVASHDPQMIAAAGDYATEAGRTSDDFEFQMLYGIRDDEQRRLVSEGRHLRVYVPYGEQWYGYFMRRLAERPANLLFFLRSLISRH